MCGFTFKVVHGINATKKELLKLASDDKCPFCLNPDSYATPKVTKYQRCNFIIQIHQFTIKIDKININFLFECVKIVEFRD